MDTDVKDSLVAPGRPPSFAARLSSPKSEATERPAAALGLNAGEAGGEEQPILDAEARLWWKYRRTGRTDLRDEIFGLYEGWAARRTRAFARSRGLEWLELWGAAVIGLIEAVKRFDPSWGVPFFAFAVRRVDGALLDAGRRALGRESRRKLPTRRSCYGLRTSASSVEPRTQSSCDGEERGNSPDSALAPEDLLPSREPDPSEAAATAEIISRVLDSMKDGRLREIARRRFTLLESVDEIGLAMGLGKTRVDELLRHECLPCARKALRQLGVA